MKKLYYFIFDTTIPYSKPKHAFYTSTYTNCDILGTVTSFAQRNNTDVSNIRLFICETKKQWEESYNKWISQIKWPQRKKKHNHARYGVTAPP